LYRASKAEGAITNKSARCAEAGADAAWKAALQKAPGPLLVFSQLELTGICAELVRIRFPCPNLDLVFPIEARWINGVPKVQAYAAFVVDGA